MAYTTAEGREELLEALAGAIDDIGLALAQLGAAYELLDEPTGGRLEADLFGPVQGAYGRAKSTYAGFAERHGLPGRPFDQPAPGRPSTGAAGFIDAAAEAAAAADHALSALQDSDLPVEVGDQELRAGIASVRERLAGVRQAARRLERGRGR